MDGYTIEGAKKILKKRNKTMESSQISILFDREKVVEIIEDLKKDLRDILKRLS